MDQRAVKSTLQKIGVFPCLALGLAAGMTVGCAAPTFNLRPPPVLSTPVPGPTLPATRPVADKPSEVHVELAAARSLPDFGQSSLGFLGFETPPGAEVGDRRSFLDQSLTMAAVNAGFKHLADLGVAPEILVALNLEKSGNGGRTSTWWAGTMAQMAHIADVSRVDYVLVGEFGALGTSKQTRETAFMLPPEELANYSARYARFRTDSTLSIQQSLAARQSFSDEYARARNAYVQEKAQQNWWHQLWMNEGDFKERCAVTDAFFVASAGQINAMQTAERNVPAPDRFQQDNQSTTTSAEVTLSVVDLTVKLLDAKTGQVVWAGHLWRSAPEEPLVGVNAVLARLLDELKPRVAGKRRR
jgi:hypothetical protein